MARIWPKRNPKAYEKALKKSASRMARSLMRMAEEPMDASQEARLKACLARFVKNKPPDRGAEIYEMVEKAYERRRAMLADYAQELIHLERQWQGMLEGKTGRIIKNGMYGPGVGITEIKRLKNSLATMENSMRAFLKKLRIARKMNPKQKKQEYDKTEKIIEERITYARQFAAVLDTVLRKSGQE